MKIIEISALPTPIPAGFCEACESALHSAGFPATVSMGPDGLHVSDAETVRGVIAAYAGSAAHVAWLKNNPSGGMMDALASLYASKILAGRNYNGKTYQIDPQSLTNISGMGAHAGLVTAGVPGAAMPANFAWIAMDNTTVPMTAPQMLAFANDVAGYVAALVLHNRQLKDEIAAAADLATLAAIDIASGWPAN